MHRSPVMPLLLAVTTLSVIQVLPEIHAFVLKIPCSCNKHKAFS